MVETHMDDKPILSSLTWLMIRQVQWWIGLDGYPKTVKCYEWLQTDRLHVAELDQLRVRIKVKVDYEMYEKGYKKAVEDVNEMGIDFAQHRLDLMVEVDGIDPMFIEGYRVSLKVSNLIKIV